MLMDTTLPVYLLKRKKSHQNNDQETWNWFVEENCKRFSAQSDGSENIFSAVICSQGIDTTLNNII